MRSSRWPRTFSTGGDDGDASPVAVLVEGSGGAGESFTEHTWEVKTDGRPFIRADSGVQFPMQEQL